VAIASLLTLGIGGSWKWYGFTVRCTGFVAGFSFCVLHKSRKAAETVEEIQEKIATAQADWEKDKAETLTQIEQAEQQYLAEIERLTQVVQQQQQQVELYQEAIAHLQQRLRDDKKYLHRIWEFKRKNPEDADKLPKIIPAVFYDWKPGARLSGTKEYNEAKRYFIELDG
jgi:hypothetical protein